MSEYKKSKCCKQVESHLDCKATAALNNQIDEELNHEDKPLAELLEEEQQDGERSEQL